MGKKHGVVCILLLAVSWNRSVVNPKFTLLGDVEIDKNALVG